MNETMWDGSSKIIIQVASYYEIFAGVSIFEDGVTERVYKGTILINGAEKDAGHSIAWTVDGAGRACNYVGMLQYLDVDDEVQLLVRHDGASDMILVQGVAKLAVYRIQDGTIDTALGGSERMAQVSSRGDITSPHTGLTGFINSRRDGTGDAGVGAEGGLTELTGAKAKNTSRFPTTNSTPASPGNSIPLVSEEFDTDAMHNNVTNNTQIIVQIDDDGFYLITATVDLGGLGGVGSGVVWINVTGQVNPRMLATARSADGGNFTHTQGCSIDFYVAGDYVEILASTEPDSDCIAKLSVRRIA